MSRIDRPWPRRSRHTTRTQAERRRPSSLVPTVTPNPNQPFGAKGAGEAGCIGTPPAVLNAIADALRSDTAETVQLPATPEQVWRLANATPS